MGIINFIVVSVVGKLGGLPIQLLLQEAVFSHGVGEKIQLLEEVFNAMQSFLEDADDKQHVDERAKKWVLQVLEVADEAEEAIDIFAYKIAPLRQKGFAGRFKRYAFVFIKLKALHELGMKIERINAKISARKRKKNDGILSISRGQGTGSEKQSLQWKFVIKHLIEREGRRFSVALVGTGGLGNITLMKKLYENLQS